MSGEEWDKQVHRISPIVSNAPACLFLLSRQHLTEAPKNVKKLLSIKRICSQLSLKHLTDIVEQF
jgi:hypothetical protein